MGALGWTLLPSLSKKRASILNLTTDSPFHIMRNRGPLLDMYISAPEHHNNRTRFSFAFKTKTWQTEESQKVIFYLFAPTSWLDSEKKRMSQPEYHPPHKPTCSGAFEYCRCKRFPGELSQALLCLSPLGSFLPSPGGLITSFNQLN